MWQCVSLFQPAMVVVVGIIQKLWKCCCLSNTIIIEMEITHITKHDVGGVYLNENPIKSANALINHVWR